MSDVAFACRLDVFDSADQRRYGVLDVAEWITLERRCCPFLGLGLEWSDGDAVWVRLTGGPGVKSFLAQALGGTLGA